MIFSSTFGGKGRPWPHAAPSHLRQRPPRLPAVLDEPDSNRVSGPCGCVRNGMEGFRGCCSQFYFCEFERMELMAGEKRFYFGNQIYILSKVNYLLENLR